MINDKIKSTSMEFSDIAPADFRYFNPRKNSNLGFTTFNALNNDIFGSVACYEFSQVNNHEFLQKNPNFNLINYDFITTNLKEYLL